MSRSRSRYFVNAYRLSEQREAKDEGSISRKIEESLKIAKDNLPKIIEEILDKEPPERLSTEGGLYVGAAGIGYAFLRLSQRSFLLAEQSREYLSLAHRYIYPSLKQIQKRGNGYQSGFLLGDAGILAVAAVASAASGNNEKAQDLVRQYVDLAKRYKPLDFMKCGSDEFFVGRAGYIYGAIYLNREFGKNVVPIDTLHELAKIIVSSGEKYAQRHKSPCPLMYSYYDTEYLGAAHGLCAILQVLIQVPGFLDLNKDAESAVRRSVDFLASLQTPTGNFPCALDEVDSTGRSLSPEENELVHWCHGAPGVIYLMAVAYLRWKDQRYLDACYRAGELVWVKGLLRKGPGICHGVAGNAYVFLLLYRLTSHQIHLYRAARFAEFLNDPQFLREARTPDEPYSLYEGLAGTACFLADFLQLDQAAFPFQDVFTPQSS